MKKIFTMAIASMTVLGASAQDISLPMVDKSAESATMMETLSRRHSVREFSGSELSEQELSNLCWAACGISRDAEHRTAPTAMNRKEIRLFVFNGVGVYEYLAKDNVLKMKVKGDHRKLIAGGAGFSQDFVLQAPVSLLMVIDFELFGSQDERAVMMCCVDAGNVSENINLYCQSVGLSTVPRATMDVDGIRRLLGFSDKQLPIMNNPVGHSK